MLNIYSKSSVLAAFTGMVQFLSSTSQAQLNVCKGSSGHRASSTAQQHERQQWCVTAAKTSAWQGNTTSGSRSRVQRPRAVPHFSMRDSSCSCRDIIWEGAKHYSEAWLGLLAASAQALLCLCGSSTYTKRLCFACTGQGAVSGHLWGRTEHRPQDQAVQQGPGSGNLLLWYLVETLQSSSGRKSIKTLRLLPFSYRRVSGFLGHVLPQAAILAALDCCLDTF